MRGGNFYATFSESARSVLGWLLYSILSALCGCPESRYLSSKMPWHFQLSNHNIWLLRKCFLPPSSVIPFYGKSYTEWSCLIDLLLNYVCSITNEDWKFPHVYCCCMHFWNISCTPINILGCVLLCCAWRAHSVHISKRLEEQWDCPTPFSFTALLFQEFSLDFKNMYSWYALQSSKAGTRKFIQPLCIKI